MVGWWRGEGFDGVGVGWGCEKLGFGGVLEKKLGGGFFVWGWMGNGIVWDRKWW